MNFKTTFKMNTPTNQIQMDKTMEQVIESWKLEEPPFIKTALVAAMKEWETLTNNSRDAKIEFYREATDKVREFVFANKDIGQPCQPLFDAIHDKLTEQKQEIERLKGLVEKVFKEDRKEGSIWKDRVIETKWQQFKTENNL